jgi:hypothetical protein
MSRGQRLVNSEVDKRIVIRPNKTIKKTDEGVNGLMFFGENNDYPQLMEKLINGSVTAKTSANVYAKFLAGAGFENEKINKIEVGTDARGKKITVQSLLRDFTKSLSRNQGSYIHCNFNLDIKIVNVHLKPFKNCRFAIPDDTGYNAKVVMHDNWEKDKDKKYKSKDVKNFNVFNVNEKAFIAEIDEAKGIDNYKGQIFFLFTDNEYFYPLSNYDEVYLDCDTESQMALFKNRQCRNGFFKKTILRIQESLTKERKAGLAESARASLGVDGDGLWIIEDEVGEDGGFSDSTGFKFEQLDSDLEDDRFKEWPKELANNIRKAAKGVPAILIDYEDNKLSGTSGEAIIQATNFYNAITLDDRVEVEEAFEEIFKNFDNEVLASNTNWKIKPLNLIEQQKDGTTDNNSTK